MILGQLEDINQITQGSDDILYVYRGIEEIWPGSALNNSNFLKYYSGNIKQSFRGWLADPTAIWDQTFVYKSTNFSTEFTGIDPNVNIQITTFEEFEKYDSSNMSTEFNAFQDTGIPDQELVYNNLNIVVEWPGGDVISDPTAIWDQTVVYNSTNFSTEFTGIDPGINPITTNFEEFEKYESSNISTEFNAYVDTGALDQELDYNYTNIPSLWLSHQEAVDPTAIWDQTVVYNSTNFSTNFTGIDPNINPITVNYIWFDKIDSSNISTVFANPLDGGVFDSNLVYSFSNITTNFID